MPTRSRTGAGSPAERIRLDGLLAREVRLAASRVVPEDARRDHARGGQGEAAERPPDEVLRPDGAREGGPEGRVRAGRAAGVEDGEVRVLLRRLDEAARESAARAGSPRGPAGAGRARCRARRRAGRRRSPRRRATPGTRSGPRAPAPSRSGGCARESTRSGVWSATLEGPVPTGAAPIPERRPTTAVARIGQERREDRKGSARRITISRSDAAEMPSTPSVFPSTYSATPRDGDEGRGHLVLREPDRALERGLDGRRGQGRAVREDDPGAQVEADREPVVLEGPLLAEPRRQVALRVRRDEPLVDVGQGLRAPRWSRRGPARSPRSGWRPRRRACRRAGSLPRPPSLPA